ncbi:hypothetical protein JXA85_01910 [Candidatus Woesearchaeota archaeon]|nr:hypothetical protein [Candidatus Woesearchaeota archaeon]
MNKFVFTGLILFLVSMTSALAVDSLSIIQTPVGLNADPGASLTATFTLNNTGDTALDISVAPITMKLNSYAFVASATPTVLSLGSGLAEFVDIAAIVPANQHAGVYSGIVNVTGTNSSGGKAYTSFTLQIQVNENPSISMNSISKTLLQGQSGTATLALTNNGNKDSTVILSLTNLYHTADSTKVIAGSNVVFAQNNLNVKYASSNSTTVTINVPSGQTAGTYAGNITATYNSKTAVSTLTVVVQEPLDQLTIDTVSVEETPGQQFSNTIKVTNTGTNTLSNLTVGFSGFGTEYNLSVTDNTAFSLAAGAEKTFTLKGIVPDDVNTKDTKSGTIVVGGFSGTLNILGESQLDFDSVDFYIGSRRTRVDDGERVSTEAKPGDKIRIKGYLENTFNGRRDDDEDVAIENIDFTIQSTDDIGDDSIDEEIDIDSVDPDDKESFEIEFTIPYDADEDTYEIELEAEGEDENGALHYVLWSMSFDVERDTHELKISEAVLSKETIDCDRSFDVATEIINIGTSIERNVVIEATSSALKVSDKVTGLRMSDDPDDDDNVQTKTFHFIVADTVRPGTYNVVVNAYREANTLEDTVTLKLVVEKCGTTEEETEEQTTEKEEEEEQEQEEVVVTEPPLIQPPVTGTVVTQPKTDKFTESTTYMLMLGVIIVLLVAVLIVAGASLAKKK